MVDVTVHLRGRPAEQRKFPSLPHRGDLIDAEGQLWRVETLRFAEAVDLYALRLSDAPAADTRAEWETWDQAPASAGPEPEPGAQRGLLQ